MNCKAKQLVMCIHGAQCPLFSCDFAHSEEELAQNELKHKEAAELHKAVRSSKKAHKKKVRLEAELEGLPEDAMALCQAQQLASSKSPDMAGDGWRPSSASANGVDGSLWPESSSSDAVGWTEVSNRRRINSASRGAASEEGGSWSPHASRASFVTSVPTEAATMASSQLSPAAIAALCTCKLSRCVAALVDMGISASDAEAAARAAGGEAEAAGNLCFSGRPQEDWGHMQVDVSGDVAKAMSWLLPPHDFPKAMVENAVEASAGDTEAALQFLLNSRRPADDISQPQTPAGETDVFARSAASEVYEASEWEPVWDDSNCGPRQDTPSVLGAVHDRVTCSSSEQAVFLSEQGDMQQEAPEQQRPQPNIQRSPQTATTQQVLLPPVADSSASEPSESEPFLPLCAQLIRGHGNKTDIAASPPEDPHSATNGYQAAFSPDSRSSTLENLAHTAPELHVTNGVADRQPFLPGSDVDPVSHDGQSQAIDDIASHVAHQLQLQHEPEYQAQPLMSDKLGKVDTAVEDEDIDGLMDMLMS